jgi:hypothetical protein
MANHGPTTRIAPGARPAATFSTAPTILGSYAHLIGRLAANRPHYLNPRMIADAADFNERADHLRTLMIAVGDYVRVSLKDIGDSSGVELDVKYVEGAFHDLTGDVTGALRNAADRMMETEAA